MGTGTWRKTVVWMHQWRSRSEQHGEVIRWIDCCVSASVCVLGCVCVGLCVLGCVCVQPDGSLALGAAVAYLSHLCGKQLPASVAIYAEVDVLSGVCGIVVTDATLRAARRAGITTIVLSERQVRGQDWELEWCFHVLDELYVPTCLCVCRSRAWRRAARRPRQASASTFLKMDIRWCHFSITLVSTCSHHLSP